MKHYYTDEFISFENQQKIAIIVDTGFMTAYQQRFVSQKPMLVLYNNQFQLTIQCDEVKTLRQKTSIENQDHIYLVVSKNDESKALKMNFHFQ